MIGMSIIRWKIKKVMMANNTSECYVLNCQCECRPCSLYRAWLKYRAIRMPKLDPENEYCFAECLNYKERGK